MRPPDSKEIVAHPIGKLSRRLLPLLALGYGIAYIDRVNISFASLQMNEQLHFSAETYGLGAGLFASLEEAAGMAQLDRVFVPAIDAATRATRRENWAHAVRQALVR